MKYYVDGFTIGGNPGLAGGFTIVDENNKLIKRETRKKSGFTNNEGEILGVAYAAILACYGDTIVTDSKTAISWATVALCGSRPDLKDMCQVLKELILSKNISLVWQPRKENLAGIMNEKDKL